MQRGKPTDIRTLSTREQLFWQFKMTPIALVIQVAIATGQYK